MAQPRVAVLTGLRSAYECGVLRGISKYALAHGPWTFRLLWGSQRGMVTTPLRWGDDGFIIIRANDETTARILSQPDIPKVITGTTPELEGAYRVMPNDEKAGELAAQHLLDQGLGTFAFFGLRSWLYSNLRRDGFARAVAAAGCRVSCWDEPPAPKGKREWWKWVSRLAQWLGALPKPAGLFACDDSKALRILDICEKYGIAVPEEISLVGVDNDEMVNGIAVPSLSSIDMDFQRVGYEAAALLERLMQHEPVPREPVYVPPRGVIHRRSSDSIAFDNPDVARAVEYIRDHADEQIKVEDVIDDLQISRRSLEQLFRKALGRSPHDEINRVRLLRVKQLLATTDLPVFDIAMQLGFKFVEHLHQVFRAETGMTPGQYRKSLRRQ